MRSIPGYSLGEPVPTGSGLVCFQGRRAADGRAVRLTLASAPRPEEEQRLVYAAEIASELSLPGVPTALEVVRRGTLVALVHADDGSVTLTEILERGPLGLRYALGLAAQAAEVLSQLHARGVVHNDICPGSVRVGPQGVTLHCLGLATRHRLEQPPLRPAEALQSHLAYLAPERSGRLARPVDHRSDLYALGALLYALLSGVPPFQERDPIQLVYAQLALTPPSLRPQVPEVVDALVARLLAKDAEDRYQSASGLAHDLRRCLRTADDQGRVPWFTLGQADIPETFTVPDRLYGREEQLALLDRAYERVCEGVPGLVLLTGASGTGKTALIQALRGRMVGRAGLMASGKTDEVRSPPLGAFVPALEDLAQQLLAEAGASLERRREGLLRRLGGLACVLVDLVPSLALVLGPQPPPPPLPPGELQSRLMVALHSLVDALSTPEQPLVLALDDVQWIDGASVQLVEYLLTGAQGSPLLLVLAWRPEDVPEDAPLVRAISDLAQVELQLTRVGVGPLDRASLSALVADSMASRPDQVEGLVDLVQARTAGNPLFTVQLLHALAAGGALHRAPSGPGWQWDAGRVAAAAFTEDVAQLMAARLASLPPETRAALSVASSLGSGFALHTLARVQGLGSGRMARVLLPAIREGLVLPTGAGLHLAAEEVVMDARLYLRFPHDRVREAAQALTPPQERPAQHLRVGRILRDVGADLFDVVGQLSKALPLIRDATERLEVAGLLLQAGRRAQATTAYDTALTWLDAGIALLPELRDPDQHDLAFALVRHRAECLHLTGDFEGAAAAFTLLESLATTPAERVELVNLRVSLLTNQGQPARAVQLGFRGCEELGFDLPSSPAEWGATTRVELGSVLRVVGKLQDEELITLPAMASERQELHLSLLATLAPAASNDPMQFPCVVARMARLSLVHGATPHTPVGFVLTGLVLLASGDADSGYRLGRAALHMALRQPRPAVLAQVQFVHAAFIQHWHEPLHQALALLEEAYASLLEVGNLPYAGWAAMNQVFLRQALGVSTSQLSAVLDGLLDTVRRTIRYRDVELILLSVARALALLTQDQAALDALDAQGLDDEGIDRQLAHYHAGRGACLAQRIFAHAALGQWEQVLELARRGESQGLFAAFPGAALLGDVTLLHGLALAHSARSQRPGPGREALIRELRQHQERLVDWSEAVPGNHEHRASLITAALAELQWDAEAAAQGWDEAMDEASRAGSAFHEALAAEEAARFHRERGVRRSARHYLAEARVAWARWGNRARLASIDAVMPDLPRPAQVGVETLDHQALIQAAQSLTRELEPRRLLQTLVDTAVRATGATLGVLFLGGAEGMRAVSVVGAQDECDDLPMPLAACPWASASVVRYTVHAGQVVVIHDASIDPRFQGKYLARQRSVLCAPLQRRDQVSGALYLAHHEARGAFTTAREELVQVLLGLTATAVENARLYSRLHLDHERVLASTFDGVLRLGTQGEVRYANPAAERILGWSDAELRNRPVQELLGEPLDVLVAQGPEEGVFPHADGVHVQVEWASRPIRDQGGAVLGAVLTFRDIGQRKLLEDQLFQSQKMEAIGQLAGGLAHDLNNLLTPVLGNLVLIQGHVGSQGEVTAHLESVRQAARRAAGLVAQMLAFSKQSEAERHLVEPGPLVHEVGQLLRGSVASSVQVSLSVEEGLDWVFADASQLYQVLLNLGVNARDAIGERPGLVRISARGERLREVQPGLVRERLPGPWVVLAVEDTGQGMEPQTLSRIFEPFYSTKEEGTGLGLAVVWGIVERHVGSLVVHSDPSQGTRVEVWMPGHEPPPEQPGPEEIEAEPQLGQGLVLVVDDEPLVRELAQAFLQHLGYEVDLAGTGGEALERYGQRAADLVLLDLGLPDMDGRQVLRSLRELDPACKILLWSGYDDAPTRASAAQLGACGFLAKPFRMPELAAAVARALLEAR